MTIKLPYPKMSSETKDKDMIELKKYLFRLIEELNNDLNTILTLTGSIDATNSSTSSIVGVLNTAMNNLSLELRSIITTNNRQVESEISNIERNYLKTSDFETYKSGIHQEMVDDLTTLENLPEEWGEEETGKAVIYGATDADRYYILMSALGNFWNGYKASDSETITWYQK